MRHVGQKDAGPNPALQHSGQLCWEADISGRTQVGDWYWEEMGFNGKVLCMEQDQLGVFGARES